MPGPGGPGGPGGPPPPPGGMGGPGPHQMQIPLRPRVQSTFTSDCTEIPGSKMDEAAYRRKLTSYEVYSIRKVQPVGKEKSTWAKVSITKEPLTQDDIAVQLKKLQASSQAVSDKKAALYPFQQTQVNKLLDKLNTEEMDPNFTWSLSQLDRREKTTNKVRETVLISVVVKRCVREDVEAGGVYAAIERNKHERAIAMNRPPPPPMQQEGPPPPMIHPPMNGPGGPPPNHGPPPNSRRPSNRRRRRSGFHSDSDSASDIGSDTDSSAASTLSSSLATTISSRSDERSRRFNSRGRRRGRSQSRHREHHKEYYNTRRDASEQPQFGEVPRNSSAQPRYIAEIPMSPVAAPIMAPPALTPAENFTQGFQLGREIERTKLLAQRPIAIDEPGVLTITGRNERRYSTPGRYAPRQYDDVPVLDAPRYSERRPRYREPAYVERRLDDLYEDDLRLPPREDIYRSRLTEAESYMRDEIGRPRIEYTGARPQIRHPFTPRNPPRRYASSYGSSESYYS
ncbi:hypothetical protein CJF30_00007703 [Rutstroemia sp. NJR-2017a BBW]|nr:hypothetical protein CJF30_00007703 [Rutstroemia sp. NJR-2017a BBW]